MGKPLLDRGWAALALCAAAAGIWTVNWCKPEPGPYRAVDGDTIAVASNGAHIRLLVIDAPEMPGHCRPGRACVSGDPYRAQAKLQAMLDDGNGTMRCRDLWHRDVYHRRLASCSIRIDGHRIDLSDAMLASGTVGLYPR